MNNQQNVQILFLPTMTIWIQNYFPMNDKIIFDTENLQIIFKSKLT